MEKTMDTGLLIGRILLVAIFIFSGTVKFIDLSGTAGHIAEQGLPAPTVLAFAAGAVEVIAGLMVAVGWHTKFAALVLAAFSLVAAFFFHDFWNLPTGEEQINQMLHAFKNVTIIGGLIVIACVGPGRFALDRRRIAT
jgi:putative oxidoreductase